MKNCERKEPIQRSIQLVQFGTFSQKRIEEQSLLFGHVQQYETRSMREEEGRRCSINEIVQQLHIEENIVSLRSRDEINITILLLRADRSDLARQMVTNTDTFISRHPGLREIGVKRVDVELGLGRGGGKNTISQWEQELASIEVVQQTE